MDEDLQRKVDRGIKLIVSASEKAASVGQVIEVAYSGGKDSDVILELVRMSGVPYRAIYKNTTIDPPKTLSHVIANGVEVRQPKRRFFELVERKGFPTRFARFCCSILKEYKILDYVILGVRREESLGRSKRYVEPEMCRVYSKKSKARHYFPILDWTSADVSAFVEERGIKCHPLYYDESGVFHPERRLGCMGCPLIYKKKRIEQFKAHPNLVKAWVKSGQRYFDTHPQSKFRNTHEDAYSWFVDSLFYDDAPKQWKELESGLIKPNHKEFLESYFKIKFD